MKLKDSAMLGAFRSRTTVTLTMLFTGVLGLFVFLANPQQHTQAQTSGAASLPPGGVTSSQQNPLQIATLHWYNANLTTQFTLGTAPYGIAFDGTNLWVANDGSNNVMKVRTNDGAIIGTFAVGTTPIAVAYDGANVWVANTTATT